MESYNAMENMTAVTEINTETYKISERFHTL